MDWTKRVSSLSGTIIHVLNQDILLLLPASPHTVNSKEDTKLGGKEIFIQFCRFHSCFLLGQTWPLAKMFKCLFTFLFLLSKNMGWQNKQTNKQKTNSLNLAKYFKLRKWVHVGLELWQKGKKKFNTKLPSCQVGECRESVDETIVLNIRYVWILNSFIN